MRSVDADGHLKVEESRISKANICPYKGSEIPRWQELGLDPERIYRLFRDPAELAKGASTFDGKPLLIRHVPVSAELPRRELWVGNVGTCTFEAPYLIARPLMVLTAEAIGLVQSEAQRELSAAYRYRAEMVPGSYGGEAFDGRMVDIQGNHVAIVSEGRAGPDVLVADEQLPEFRRMKHADFIKRMQSLGLFAKDLSQEQLIALDSSLGETPAKSVISLDKELSEDEMKAACDEALEEKRKEHGADAELDDEEKEKAFERARDKKAKDKKAKDKKMGKDAAGKNSTQNASDADPDHREDFDPPAKDSKMVTADQMNAAIKAALSEQQKQNAAVIQAREAVRPIVGVVSLAMDSADSIYKFALEKAGIDPKDIHPSAYPALLELAKKGRPSARAGSLAMDAAGPGPAKLDELLGLH